MRSEQHRGTQEVARSGSASRRGETKDLYLVSNSSRTTLPLVKRLASIRLGGMTMLRTRVGGTSPRPRPFFSWKVPVRARTLAPESID